MKMFATFFSAIAEKMAAVYGMTTADFLAQETSSCARTTTTPSFEDDVKSALRGRINHAARVAVSDRKVGIVSKDRDLGIQREMRRAEKRAARRTARAYEKALIILSRKAQEIADLTDEISEAEALCQSFGSVDRAEAVTGASLRALRRALSRAVRDRAFLAGRGFATLVARVTASLTKWDADALERRLECERGWTYQHLDLTKVSG